MLCVENCIHCRALSDSCAPQWGWDSGKDPASVLGNMGFASAQHLLPILAADWGQLHLRVQTSRLISLVALSPSTGAHPSCPPWGLRHKHIPLGRARLTEVRRMQRHSSDRMATIARETELCSAAP